MKDYSAGTWGLAFIFSLEGSVFPRAFVVAVPNACLAICSWYFWRETEAQHVFEDASGISVGQVWSAFNFIVGFVVSFRASRAYSRWWEGGTLLQQARGEWFNAYSSLIAFSSADPQKNQAVAEFQHSLSRLVSMLHASALMSVSTEEGIDFEIIDATGIQSSSVQYIKDQSDKCEIIMQWIQRLVVLNMGNGVLPIPPPVISRVFQELSRGIVNIHNVRKITEFQFPFPLAQMIVTMLIVQWLATPLICSLLVGSPIWAATLSFFPIFACWGINFVAAEIEQPFGTDPNDMPMHFMQAALNTSIMALLDTEAQNPPAFDMRQSTNQYIFIHEPSMLGGSPPTGNLELPEMRSALFLTVRDPIQLKALSRRFGEPRRITRNPSRYANNRQTLGTINTRNRNSLTSLSASGGEYGRGPSKESRISTVSDTNEQGARRNTLSASDEPELADLALDRQLSIGSQRQAARIMANPNRFAWSQVSRPNAPEEPAQLLHIGAPDEIGDQCRS